MGREENIQVFEDIQQISLPLFSVIKTGNRYRVSGTSQKQTLPPRGRVCPVGKLRTGS